MIGFRRLTSEYTPDHSVGEKNILRSRKWLKIFRYFTKMYDKMVQMTVVWVNRTSCLIVQIIPTLNFDGSIINRSTEKIPQKCI